MVNRSRLIFVAICVASIEARVAHDFLKDYPVCTRFVEIVDISIFIDSFSAILLNSYKTGT